MSTCKNDIGVRLMVNRCNKKNYGRPIINVDLELIVSLHDIQSLGWMKGAEEYRKTTGQWISKDTFKRRYLMRDKPRSSLNNLFDREKTIKNSLDGDISS